MNRVNVMFGGEEYSLLFNGFAMFAEKEIFGQESNIAVDCQKPGVEGFKVLCKAVSLLSEQGELARRYEGQESRKTLTEEQIAVTASPLDIIRLRTALVKAVLKGYEREIEEGEKDLGLAELEKKTDKD